MTRIKVNGVPANWGIAVELTTTERAVLAATGEVTVCVSVSRKGRTRGRRGMQRLGGLRLVTVAKS